MGLINTCFLNVCSSDIINLKAFSNCHTLSHQTSLFTLHPACHFHFLSSAFILTFSSNMPILSFFTDLTKPRISLESLYWQKNPYLWILRIYFWKLLYIKICGPIAVTAVSNYSVSSWISLITWGINDMSLYGICFTYLNSVYCNLTGKNHIFKLTYTWYSKGKYLSISI